MASGGCRSMHPLRSLDHALLSVTPAPRGQVVDARSARATCTTLQLLPRTLVRKVNGMRNRHWTELARYDEIADIIIAQLHVYIREGTGIKALRIVAKIRRRTRGVAVSR